MCICVIVIDNYQTMKFDSIKKFMTSAVGVYLIWALLHYISPHLYVRYCVPATVTGLIMSVFIAPAPHCQALRWTIYNGGNAILAMWIFVGTLCMQYLIPVSTQA
jgi:hypothetical protein